MVNLYDKNVTFIAGFIQGGICGMLHASEPTDEQIVEVLKTWQWTIEHNNPPWDFCPRQLIDNIMEIMSERSDQAAVLVHRIALNIHNVPFLLNDDHDEDIVRIQGGRP